MISIFYESGSLKDNFKYKSKNICINEASGPFHLEAGVSQTSREL